MTTLQIKNLSMRWSTEGPAWKEIYFTSLLRILSPSKTPANRYSASTLVSSLMHRRATGISASVGVILRTVR